MLCRRSLLYLQALKKESRQRLHTSRESVARQKKEKPEFSEAPKSARRPSYVEDSRCVAREASGN